MATVRDAILRGTKAATKLHNELGMRLRAQETGSVDVFKAILSTGAALIFRPLDGLLGACLPGNPAGVLISTQRPLRVQRFTGAHELGHVVMGHEPSLDGEEILRRGPARELDLQEVEADAFAAEFLLPRWILEFHARRQGWNARSMAAPQAVYQLALRIGASYDATCRALQRHRIVSASDARRLLDTARRSIKVELCRGLSISDWRRDVWLLTEKDDSLVIQGQPEDLFILHLKEATGAGYLWNIDDLKEAGFAVVNDERVFPDASRAIGAHATRELTAEHPEPAAGTFTLNLRRPWERQEPPQAQLNVSFDLFGREVGIARAVRRHLQVV
jgi:hypothetical protein